MAHWCLRDVDYDVIEFLTVPCARRIDADSVGKRCPDDTATGSGDTTRCCVVDELRFAILSKENRHVIARLVSDWPQETLRLIDAILPEECDQVFNGENVDSSVDYLWLAILRGLLSMSKRGSLRCVDLSGFVPTKAMTFTFLQLLPFIGLGAPDSSTTQRVYDMVAPLLPDDDLDLKYNARKLIESVLCHRILSRGHKVEFPKGRLDIVVDFLPITSATLPFLCFIIARSISHVTNVYVTAKNLIYTYVDCGLGNTLKLTRDPITPLYAVTEAQPIAMASGVAVQGVPTDKIAEVLHNVLATSEDQQEVHSRRSVPDKLRLLNKLSIANCQLELSSPSHADPLFSILATYRSISRLDLSGTCVDGRLDVVLAAVADTVEYLGLSGCRLESTDIVELLSTQRRRLRALRDLDLSYIYSTCCTDCTVDSRASRRTLRWNTSGSNLDRSDSDDVTIIRDSAEHAEVEDSGLDGSPPSFTMGDSSQLVTSEIIDETFSESDSEMSNSEAWSTSDDVTNVPLPHSTRITVDDNEPEHAVFDEPADCASPSSLASCSRRQRRRVRDRRTAEHREDRSLVSLLLRSLGGATEALPLVAILDVANDCFRFRLPDCEFESLVRTVERAPRLRHISVESFPLWDNDIVMLVEKAAAASTRPTASLQSIAVTRSTDAPRTDLVGRSELLKRLVAAKRGQQMRVSIGNHLGVECTRHRVSDDDVTGEY